MKNSHLKHLVKEIVSQTLSELEKTYNLTGDNIVEINKIQLPDGRSVTAELSFTGNWDNGGFDWAQGMASGTQTSPRQFNIERYKVNKIWDEATQQDIPSSPQILDVIYSAMEDIIDDVADEMSQG